MLKQSSKPAKKNAPIMKVAAKSMPSKNGAKATPAKTTAAKATAGPAKMKAGKRVYFFGPGGTEGGAGDKILLGGKGANLADMTSIGLPVPPGFTITTETCREYNDLGGRLPDGTMDEIGKNLKKIERATGKKFGDPKKPLLLSVRSGAAVSMPGMMDTVLNLGMTDEVAGEMAGATDNPRFVYDSYRRLINMFGDVVMGVEHEFFEHELTAMKEAKGVKNDTDLDADDLKELVEKYKKVYSDHLGAEFPQEPMTQLEKATEAVFKSWNTDRAIKYRRLNDITGLHGTAVNCQTMVFGNMGDDCATGVAFTRDPNTGENVMYAEYLINAQGEDVVAGIRTPKHFDEMKTDLPASYKEIMKVRQTLEDRYRDIQDFEFTVEQGTLYMLQTRNGKRGGKAALKVAMDMLKEKKVDEAGAVKMVNPEHLDQLLHPMLDPDAVSKATSLTKGLNASPGAAVGKLAFTADEAEERVARGEKVILVRRETEPADIGGMKVAEGILTSTGGNTSHAAVVARGMGTPCICGAGEVKIDAKAMTCTIGDRTFGPNDFLSIDGGTGEVYAGELPTKEPEIDANFAKFMKLVDKHRTLKVRTNADTPADAKQAREYGAEGIGLCRTEHMFFEPGRIEAVREMILASAGVDPISAKSDESEDDYKERVKAREQKITDNRRRALDKLQPYQKEDFVGLFREMDGLPVTVRLLDPPLHEFLPHSDKDMEELATSMGVDLEDVQARVQELHELNPMLGHRGCRLAVTFPEILEMQVRAILEAAVEVKKDRVKVTPEIMIPLVGTVRELKFLKPYVTKAAEEVMGGLKKSERVDYTVGTMIEVPRAAVTADEIAREADFFSFGTNDLTQMTYGYSRDDAGVFLKDYLDPEKAILENDPFQTLDPDGVGALVKMGVEKGRSVKPDLKVGICGEHGGDPKSVAFCHKVGMNYVSCSPFRVPIARLAAAQAAIKDADSAKKTDAGMKAKPSKQQAIGRTTRAPKLPAPRTAAARTDRSTKKAAARRR